MELNLKQISLIVGILLAINLISNFIFSTKTETDVWKQMSIESIYSVGKWEEIDKIKTDGINKMAVELKELGIDEVDAILNRYLSQNGN